MTTSFVESVGLRRFTGLRWVIALALLAPVVALLLIASTLVMGVWFVPGTQDVDAAEASLLCSFLLFPFVGALIAGHRPSNAIGWLLIAVGLLVLGAASLDEVAQYLVLDPARGTETSALLRWLQNLMFLLAFGLSFTFLLLLYPEGHLPSRRWRWLAWAVALALGVMVLAAAVTPGPVGETLPLDNPYGIAALGGLPAAVSDGVYLVLSGLALACLTSFVLRWRRSRGAARRRLAWLALAAVVVVLSLAATMVAASLGQGFLMAAARVVMVVSIPAATAAAIFRDRLFDIEVVLGRTTVYALLTGAVLASYAACLAATSGLLASHADVGAALLASTVVAVLLGSVKERIERRVDRLLFGDRSRPYAALVRLGTRLQETASAQHILPEVARTVREVLRLPYVAIELVGLPAAVSGKPTAAIDVHELVLHGQSQGRLLIGHHGPSEDFDTDERALLADIARQVSVAAHAVRLTDDLQRARERLVSAREQERLRLRRELHDGLGAVLAGLTLQVDALRRHVDPQDDDGTALLRRVKTEVGQCMDDVRRIVEGLRPPALDQLGLVGVVSEHAAALSAGGLTVDVDCHPGLVVRDPAAEVAAYRILTEALTNVVRHAHATHCDVRIATQDGSLQLWVSDDGRGLCTGLGTGLGLASMKERTAELGGSFALDSEPGRGTTVHAALPLKSPP